MVTYSTICTRHIEHNNNDVIIVEVKITRQNFQKVLNPETNQNVGVWRESLEISDILAKSA